MKFRLLLLPKLLSVKNSVNLKSFFSRLPVLVLGAAFWWLLYAGVLKLLSFLGELGMAGIILSDRLFSLILSGLFGFMLLSSVIAALSCCYLAKDIPFLLAKPIGIRDLQWLKMAESIFNSSWMVISFVPPLLIAFGVHYEAAAMFYAMLFAGLMFYILLAGGIGIIMAHLLTRFFPAGMSRNILLGIGLLLFIVVYAVLKSAIPEQAAAPEDILNAFLKMRSESRLFPGYWINASILPYLKGRETDNLYFLLLAGSSIFSLIVAQQTGAWLYLGNLERLHPIRLASEGRSLLSRWYPGRPAALFYKDMNIFFRDAGQWSQLFIIAALIWIYIGSFRSIPVNALREISPFILEGMLMLNMLVAGLVLTAVSARFIFPLVSLEGEAFWVLRTAPVKLKGFLLTKFIYGSVPISFIVTLLAFWANAYLRLHWQLTFLSTLTVLMLCFSVSGLGTGMGAIYPKFKHENIASVSVSGGSLFFMVIAFALVCATLSLEAWAFYILYIRTDTGTAGRVIAGAAILSMLLINAAACYFPLKIGAQRLTALTSTDL